ncbi:MAG: flavin reductase family protein [Bacillota bacterium]
MKVIKYNKYFTEVTEALSSNGAFLTVKVDDKVNTMTIGWANIGYIWSKPIVMVAVRKSRYTYNLIEKSNDFTVSVPFVGKMVEELKFCGSKSGRNYDKFSELDMQIINGQKVNSPLIKGCDIHYECQIVYKQDMKGDKLIDSYKKNHYKNEDYHTLYFGEILNCLKTS